MTCVDQPPITLSGKGRHAPSYKPPGTREHGKRSLFSLRSIRAFSGTIRPPPIRSRIPHAHTHSTFPIGEGVIFTPVYYMFDFDHLARDKFTYFSHLNFAFKLGCVLFVLALVSFFHAIFPFLFSSFVSSRIESLNKMIDERAENG